MRSDCKSYTSIELIIQMVNRANREDKPERKRIVEASLSKWPHWDHFTFFKLQGFFSTAIIAQYQAFHPL